MNSYLLLPAELILVANLAKLFTVFSRMHQNHFLKKKNLKPPLRTYLGLFQIRHVWKNSGKSYCRYCPQTCAQQLW